MKKYIVFVVMLGLMLALIACSGGSQAVTELNVSLAEFTFTPTTFTIPAGQEITLNLTNKGAVIHEFVIMKAGKEVSIPFNDDDEPNIYWELEVKPGESATAKFTAPEAGEYQVVCGTEGHTEAGMIGKLTVVQP